MSQVN